MRARMIARSYSAKASMIRRMRTEDGSSSTVPSPAAETIRAPRLAPLVIRWCLLMLDENDALMWLPGDQITAIGKSTPKP